MVVKYGNAHAVHERDASRAILSAVLIHPAIKTESNKSDVLR